MLALALALVLDLGLAAAPPPTTTWHPDIGTAWRDALPAAHGRTGTTVAVLADRPAWRRLVDSLPSHVVLPRFDPRREIALVVVYDSALALELQDFTRVGSTGTLTWRPSPYFVAFEGPQLLVHVVPRRGLARIVFRDASRAPSTRDLGPLTF